MESGEALGGVERALLAPNGDGAGKRLVLWVAARVAGGFSLALGPQGGSALGILLYHRVTPSWAAGPAPTWNVPPSRFRAQLEGLLARGYRPWPLRRAVGSICQGEPVPARTFVVTFDDGYENVYRHAWPILQQLGVPATVFLATAYLDRPAPFPFDDWPLAGSPQVPAESWRPLASWQCQQMARQGLVELGSHTHTHEDFRGRPQALCEDLLQSLQVLQERFAVADPMFSFPHGDRRRGFSGPELAAAAGQAGVLCCLTTEQQRVGPHSNLLDWGRFGVLPTDTAATLAGKLDGWSSLGRDTCRRLLTGLMCP